MKSIMKVLAAAAVLGLSQMPAQAQDKTIKLGAMIWENVLPVSGVMTKVLEDKASRSR